MQRNWIGRSRMECKFLTQSRTIFAGTEHAVLFAKHVRGHCRMARFSTLPLSQDEEIEAIAPVLPFSLSFTLSLARTFELVALCASQFSADVRNSNVTSSSHTYISIYIHTYTYQRHSLKCNTSAAEDDVVTKIVTQFRDHPSILFWYTNDELGVRL